MGIIMENKVTTSGGVLVKTPTNRQRKGLLSYIKPMLVLSKINFFAPIVWTDTTVKPMSKIARGIYLLTSALLICLALYTAYTMLGPIKTSLSNFVNKSFTFISDLRLYCLFSSGSVVALNSLWRYKERIKVYNRLIKLDKALAIEHKQLLKLQIFFCVLLILHFAQLLMSTSVLFMKVKAQYDFTYFELWCVLFLSYVTMYVPFLVDVIWISCVAVLYLQFKVLNKKLYYLRKEQNLRPGYQHRINDHRLLSDKIHELLVLYSKLYKTKELINTCYGFQLLTSCTLLFVELVYKVFLTLVLIKEDTTELSRQIFAITYFVSLIGKLFLISTTSCFISNEMNQSALLVNRLALLNSISSQTEDKLRQFSLTLLHLNKPFDACGLFYISRSLMISIMGTVATYIIILVQFEQSDES